MSFGGRTRIRIRRCFAESEIRSQKGVLKKKISYTITDQELPWLYGDRGKEVGEEVAIITPNKAPITAINRRGPLLDPSKDRAQKRQLDWAGKLHWHNSILVYHPRTP
jgi:hypothetical protein